MLNAECDWNRRVIIKYHIGISNRTTYRHSKIPYENIEDNGAKDDDDNSNENNKIQENGKDEMNGISKVNSNCSLNVYCNIVSIYTVDFVQKYNFKQFVNGIL